MWGSRGLKLYRHVFVMQRKEIFANIIVFVHIFYNTCKRNVGKPGIQISKVNIFVYIYIMLC